MSHDAISNWVEKAKMSGEVSESAAASTGVQVIKRAPAPQSRGNAIMEIAEKIRPWLLKMFDGIRDENEMLIQPARVRAIALNVAQSIVIEQEKKAANA